MPSYKDIINNKNQSDNSVINYHSIKNKISAALQARFNINFNEFNSCKRVYKSLLNYRNSFFTFDFYICGSAYAAAA